MGGTVLVKRRQQSSAYQIAVTSQAIADIAALLRVAEAAGKRLPTLTLDGEIAFESPDARQEFARELTETIAGLVRKHHTDNPAGRRYTLYVGAYPKPKTDRTDDDHLARRRTHDNRGNPNG